MNVVHICKFQYTVHCKQRLGGGINWLDYYEIVRVIGSILVQAGVVAVVFCGLLQGYGRSERNAHLLSISNVETVTNGFIICRHGSLPYVGSCCHGTTVKAR